MTENRRFNSYTPISLHLLTVLGGLNFPCITFIPLVKTLFFYYILYFVLLLLLYTYIILYYVLLLSYIILYFHSSGMFYFSNIELISFVITFIITFGITFIYS